MFVAVPRALSSARSSARASIVTRLFTVCRVLPAAALSAHSTATRKPRARVPVGAPRQTTKAKGDALELRLARLLARSGAWRVRRNVILRDAHGHISEIDVAAGLFFVRYYECKNYAPGHPVGLEDVAKFKAVLELNGIPASRGTVVTSGRFSPRCATIGVPCVDGDALRAWERRAARTRLLRWTVAAGLAAAIVGAAVLEFAAPLAAALHGSALDDALARAGLPGAPAALLTWNVEWRRWKAAWGLPER